VAERRALDQLALAGRPLSVGKIGPAAGALLDGGFVRVSGDDVWIRHGLIAEAIDEAMDPDGCRELHLQLAGLIDDPAERARHLAAAGRRPESLAVALAALESETDPLTRAVLLTVAAETSDEQASAARVRASTALAAIGRYADAAELLASPIEGDDHVQAEGAAARAAATLRDGDLAEARSIIEAARGLRPDPGSAAAIELASTQASVLHAGGRLADAIDLLERAVAVCSADVSGYRLAGQLAALRLHDARTDRLDDLETAIRASFAAGDGAAAADRAIDLCSITLALRGGRAAVAAAVDAGDRLAALGYPTRAMELLGEAARAAVFAGDLTGALTRAESTLEEPLGRIARQRLACTRGMAQALLGRVEEAERTLAEIEALATDDFDGRGAVLWSWAEACLWGGQPARALELATASLTFAAAHDVDLVLPALARAWAEVELGLAPTEAIVEVPFRLLAGAAPELRGLRALARGDHRRAAAEFDEAARLWAGFHAPRELVCRWAAGDALQRAGDRITAVEWLRAAEASAEAIGFKPLAARARRSLRVAGERTGYRRPGARSDGLLTGREREVLALVERGLTNAEVARRMGLGRPTVARMLSNAMLRLGADSRAQAVVLAARI
jgi:DNA-binding CsgD family transcriptional regulator